MLRKSLLEKVRKFELPSSKRLGDITKKPRGGAPEAPPPARNRVKGAFHATFTPPGEDLADIEIRF